MEGARYVPCLRWKRGESQALARVSAQTRTTILPLIEIPEFGYDFDTRRVPKTLEEHLNAAIDRLRKAWPRELCLADLRLINAPDPLPDDDQAVNYVFSGLRSFDVQAIPVATLGGPGRLSRAIAKIIRQDNRGVAIRMGIEEAADQRDARERIVALLAALSVAPGATDLVLDLGAPSFEPIDDFATLVERTITALPHLRRWRSLTLLAGSLPETLAGLPRGHTVLPRQEWRLYRLLVERLAARQIRLPIFGDYGIGHPGVIYGDMRLLKPSAAIRYTVPDAWLISRGTTVRAPGGFQQFHRMCREIIGSKHYSGRGFSAGDQQISVCAAGESGPGNLTTWRYVGTSHHLERLTRDLSSLRGTSGPA